MNRKTFNRIVRALATQAAIDARKGVFKVPEDIEGDADLTELYTDEFNAARNYPNVNRKD